MNRDKNIFKHLGKVTKEARAGRLGHKAAIIWFTGLSGSGKSTLAVEVESMLHREGVYTYLLDGDNLRLGLNNDLGFSETDRKENIRRVGEVSRLFTDAGMVVLASFISPAASERKKARSLVGENEFIEVFVNCPLDICESRDVKGLYARARKGEIESFTGISAAYEKPVNPEIEVHTDQMDIRECCNLVTQYVLKTIKL